MKAPSPAFSLYPKDMLSDEHCAAMSNEEFGCYMRLLCHAWLEGSAPSDPIKLQRILRIRPQTFIRIWPALAPCFTEQDGRLFQSRLERERSQQVERSVINAAKGRKGGRPAKSTKQESRGFDSVKPSESLPSPSPSPSPETTTDKRIAAAIAPADSAPPFKSARAVDIYRRFYPDGEPSPVMLKALKPLVAKHGWEAVEPEMEAFLASSNTTFRSWPKFAEGFGTWANGTNGNGAGNGNGRPKARDHPAVHTAGEPYTGPRFSEEEALARTAETLAKYRAGKLTE